MSYRRALLTRWSRRDTLAVVIVAVSVAFLAGTALLVVGIGAESTAMAAEYGTPSSVEAYDSVSGARANAPPNATVVPFAAVEGPNGSRTLVLGRPENASGAVETLLGPPGAEPESQSGARATLGTVGAEATRRVVGESGSATLSVTPRSSGNAAIAPRWYVAGESTVERLGASGAFVVEPNAGDDVPRRGVPVKSVLAFFVLGIDEIVRMLGVVAAGSGLLVGVVVWSVTRMSVRDRLPTIRVIRATGGGPGTILALFGLRSLLLTSAGIALGYAVGVVAVNAAVNVAVFLGSPVSIDVTMTRAAARIVAAVTVGVAAIGALAGVVATVHVVRADPAALTGEEVPTRRTDASRIRRLLGPRLLSWRALVPTTATLTAFVAFAVLVVALSGVVAPLASDDGATVTEPGAVHPIASGIPESTADTLRARGVDASGEILLFEAADGQPFIARGANYSDYAAVTDATLKRGRPPDGPAEAVVGEDLAATLGVDVGETVTVGGSTHEGLDRVTVVGVFDAPGHYDDELLVSLPAARELIDAPDGVVQFVRAERIPEEFRAGQSVRVSDVRVPDVVTPDTEFDVTVRVVNAGSQERTRELTVSFRDQRTVRRVTLAPGERRDVTLTFDSGSAGDGTVAVGEVSRSVTVAARDEIEFGFAPAEAPPGTRPLVVVQSPFGDPVPNATVTVGEFSATTDERGRVRIPLNDSGDVTVEARSGEYRATHEIRVTRDAARNVSTEFSLTPTRPDIQVRPQGRLRVFNPWNDAVERTVRLRGPGVDLTRTVTVAPGETSTVQATFARQQPGTYAVEATLDGDAAVRTTYQVVDDERVISALASGGRAGSSGIGRAAETAFGNLRLVLAVLVLLAGAMSVGGTTAAFAQAVQARRRTVGVLRSTGAAPVEIVRVLVGDALRIGSAASVLSLCLAWGGLRILDAEGYLTAFGVRLSPSLSPRVVAGVLAGALVVTLVGAGLVAIGQVRTQPWTLLSPPQTGVDDAGGDRA